MSVSLEYSHSRKDSTMESLEKQLICPICLEMFSKPVVILPCQHNLCRKCANDVFQASNPYLSVRSGSSLGSGGRFRCPSCRHEVVLDRHGVYGLQRNLLVENIIDMYKQESTSTSTKPEPERKCDAPMCEEHAEEKINIYCESCGVPTCSMCKVFGAHKDCTVALLNTVYEKQKTELSEGIALLVGNNDRIQGIISQLEESCRTVEENGRRQKSRVCEMLDHLYALLEDRKGGMTLQINAEQEEKLDYIRMLTRKYNEHLEIMAKVVEMGIQTMDEPEMAVFLQNTKPLLQKIVEGSNMSHLDKVERGYENMDHFTTNFERQKHALLTLDFIRDEEEEEEGGEEGNVVGVSGVSQAAPGSAIPTPTQHSPTTTPQSPASSQHNPASTQSSHTPTQQTSTPIQLTPTATANPPRAAAENPASPPTQTSTQSPAHSPMAEPPAQASSNPGDSPRHVFSFSWLNSQK